MLIQPDRAAAVGNREIARHDAPAGAEINLLDHANGDSVDRSWSSVLYFYFGYTT
jgi:hypothetical protein